MSTVGGASDKSLSMLQTLFVWHDCSMARVRIFVTVDEDLIAAARALGIGDTDSSLIEQALRDLVARHKSAQIDASYNEAYGRFPIDTPDAWGDLASFNRSNTKAF